MSERVFSIDLEFYPESAVDDAIADFSDVADIRRTWNRIAIVPPEGWPDAETVYDELLNYLVQSIVTA